MKISQEVVRDTIRNLCDKTHNDDPEKWQFMVTPNVLIEEIKTLLETHDVLEEK